MDLGSESSVNPENVCLADEHKIEHNGSYSNEIDKLKIDESLEVNSTENLLPGMFTPLTGPSPGEGSVPLKKGVGLRKWRRIRRDDVKDSRTSLDSAKVVKRGLSAPQNPAKHSQFSVEARQNSEGSVGSINMAKHRSLVDGFAAHASSSDSRFAAGIALAAGTDSDNSEDRSSKSSTAASVPTAKYDLPVVSGYTREMNKVNNLSGKNLGSSSQRVQQGKGRPESSKKHRGERVKTEKKNSYSSMESDSRSTNFVFMQGTTTSNGKLSRASVNYDGENSDEARASEQEEMQSGHSKENGQEAEDISPDGSAAELSWGVKEEKSEYHQSSNDRDPLVECMLTLQSMQEALEQELQKFEAIGKEYASPSSVAADFSSGDPSSDQTGYEKTTQAPSSSETQLLKLSENIKLLEIELEQLRDVLQAKDLKIAELETASSSGSSAKEKPDNAIHREQEKYKEMETQIDEFWKEKIEAEIECMVIVMETRKYRIPAIDQITLLEEQKALAEHQAELVDKLEETENKAETVKKQAEDLDQCCGDLLGTVEMFDMKKRVCRVTSCFFTQVILLIFVIWMSASQFLPQTEEIVPT